MDVNGLYESYSNYLEAAANAVTGDFNAMYEMCEAFGDARVSLVLSAEGNGGWELTHDEVGFPEINSWRSVMPQDLWRRMVAVQMESFILGWILGRTNHMTKAMREELFNKCSDLDSLGVILTKHEERCWKKSHDSAKLAIAYEELKRDLENSDAEADLVEAKKMKAKRVETIIVGNEMKGVDGCAICKEEVKTILCTLCANDSVKN